MNNLEIFLNLNNNEINAILVDKEKKNQIFKKVKKLFWLPL